MTDHSNHPSGDKDPNKLAFLSPTAWRVFFAFNCLLIFLNLLLIPYVEVIGIVEIVDFTFTNVAFVGLCGFIFVKPIGSVAFWRYFFYASTIESLLLFILFPLFQLPIYGQPLFVDVWYFIGVANTFLTLVALNLYAYKLKFIWE